MPIYTTEYVMNLSTGLPFNLEVSEEDLRYLEERRAAVEAGGNSTNTDVKDFVTRCEFSFFPSYQELLGIFSRNGFTIELITQILTEFGVQKDFIPKLLEDPDYIANIHPWFAGITHDGGRAAGTMAVVYDSTKRYFSPTDSVARRLF